MNKEYYKFDFLVIGSGLAGLTSALKLAKIGKVALLSKGGLDDTNTARAQGGIACVIDHSDSYKEHVEDTINAGGNLCDEDIAKKIVEAGPKELEKLINYGGVQFTTRGEMGDKKHSEDYHLGMEGGHHKRRVLHAGDITGLEIQRGLMESCLKNDNITYYTNHMAVDLISSYRLGISKDHKCLGAYALDIENNIVKTFIANATVLATGGAGKVYLYTSNPDIACGSGVAMAYRAYGKIANMEFFQFHPTILYHPNVRSFLISEAVRGEGAVLKVQDRHGKYVEFMHKYHEMKSLAPRDVVARAIDNEMKRNGSDCVYLDITSQDETFLQKRFPNIFAECLKIGVNMSKDFIPVVPAAHYCCGGILTDDKGFTGIEGLYAAGETACNGFHGANRLASNSLLEAMVIPEFIKEDIKANLDRIKLNTLEQDIPYWETGDAKDSDELVIIKHNWEEIRHFMWDYVGIVRTDKRLERAKSRIQNIRHEIEKYYWDFYITSDLIELRNISTVAEIIIDSALKRKESRGLHYNADYVNRDEELNNVNTIVQKYQKPHFE